MLIKNLRWGNGLLSLPWLLPYEMGRMVYVTVLEPSSLKAVGDVLKLLPKMLAKRRQIKQATSIPAREIRSWFV